MPEYTTTRVYYSKKLDDQTYSELALIAKRLGILRKIIWHQFSSNPKKLNDRKIRDIWLREKENGTNLYPKIIDQLPARLWKETLRDTIGNINLKQALLRLLSVFIGSMIRLMPRSLQKY